MFLGKSESFPSLDYSLSLKGVAFIGFNSAKHF